MSLTIVSASTLPVELALMVSEPTLPPCPISTLPVSAVAEPVTSTHATPAPIATRPTRTPTAKAWTVGRLPSAVTFTAAAFVIFAPVSRCACCVLVSRTKMTCAPSATSPA